MTPDFAQLPAADAVLSLHRRLLAAKHVKAIGPGLWLLLTLLDQRTGPRGEVDHGEPVLLRDLAGRLGLSERTVSAHLHRLEHSGYIRLGRTDCGIRVEILEQLWVPTRVKSRQMDDQGIGRNLPVPSHKDRKKPSDLTVITNKSRGESPKSNETSSIDSGPSSTDPISNKARLVAEVQGLPPQRAETRSWRDGAARLTDVDDHLIRACLADAELWRDRQGGAIPPGYVADRLPRWLASRPKPQLSVEDWQALQRQGLFEEGKRLFEAHDVDRLHRLCERAWEAAE